MVNILLLLQQEMIRHRIERVGPKFVVPQQDGKQIKLNSPLDVHDFIYTFPVSLALENPLLDHCLLLYNTTQVRECGHSQSSGTLQEVGQVEVVDVVSGENVRVYLRNMGTVKKGDVST